MKTELRVSSCSVICVCSGEANLSPFGKLCCFESKIVHLCEFHRSNEFLKLVEGYQTETKLGPIHFSCFMK